MKNFCVVLLLSPVVLRADSPATGKDHWSFQPVKDAPVPQVKNTAWVRNPIDAFVLAKLEDKGLAPSPGADKVSLIRRATFDLTGLPPTPEDIDAFLSDSSTDAFSKVVERLLASPHYGERWGRHWLDVVRYADTAGDSSDYPVPQAHLYRNYVIDAFNNDKPYDQFLREQIAGDLLPASSDAERNEKLIATGYLAESRRFSVRPEFNMHLTIEDTIDVLGKSVLGLTVACARCHDHKFDPVSQADYYALYGIFNSTRYPFAGSENDQYQKDFVPLAGQHSEAADEAAKELEKKKASLESELKELREKLRAGRETLSGAERDKLREDSRKKSRELGALVKKGESVPNAYAVADVEEPKDAKIQLRGEPDKQGETVPRRFLQVLGGQAPPDCKGSGRLQLAGWIADKSNPLTARVMVNRIWQYHFGEGLVRTPSDFGARGKRPTHPELLDCLATRFVESGWSVKAMHRLIMSSATYQLSSKVSPAAALADAGNELLSHFARQRLDAESIRDAMLFVSGELDPAVTPGAPPFPPMQKWNFTQHNAFAAVYPSKQRSVYLMTQRIRKHPFLEVFDGADPNISTGQRLSSTTPIQALLVMNDPFVHEQAEKFAGRIFRLAPDDAARVQLGYRLALGRPPTADELARATEYLKQVREAFKENGTSASDVDRAGLASVARVLLATNEFIYID